MDGLHILPVRLQQSSEGVAEGVPTDSFVNAGRSCDMPDVPLHQIVRPVGLLAPRCPEEPVWPMSPFAVSDHLMPDGSNHANLQVLEAYLVQGKASPHRFARSEEHTSELQSLRHLVCRLLL